MTRDRIISGAVLIKLAAAFKGPPLLFVGYLAFRRRWLAAGATTVVALGANLLPDLIARPAGETWFGRWVGRILCRQSALQSGRGMPISTTFSISRWAAHFSVWRLVLGR